MDFEHNRLDNSFGSLEVRFVNSKLIEVVGSKEKTSRGETRAWKPPIP
jgi:hypothetical protein